MKYNVLSISPFDKQLKRLTKIYPSLKLEFQNLLDILEENPQKGTSLGNSCFKIRLALASNGKGKSGGARVITNFLVSEYKVYLLSIYDKLERENITDKELLNLLNQIE